MTVSKEDFKLVADALRWNNMRGLDVEQAWHIFNHSQGGSRTVDSLLEENEFVFTDMCNDIASDMYGELNAALGNFDIDEIFKSYNIDHLSAAEQGIIAHAIKKAIDERLSTQLANLTVTWGEEIEIEISDKLRLM